MLVEFVDWEFVGPMSVTPFFLILKETEDAVPVYALNISATSIL